MIATLSFRHKLVWYTLLLCSTAGCKPADMQSADMQSADMQSLVEQCAVSSSLATSITFTPDDSICGGYFEPEPEQKYQEDVNFSADESNINARSGMSYLQGHTHVAYKNASLFADKLCLQQDKNIAVVKGNAKFSRNEEVIFADSILWDIKNHAYLQNASFKIPMPSTNLKTAWGSAKSISVSDDKIDLISSSYSICSPNNPIWRLDAGSLSLDKTAQQGYATNVLFRLYEAPVFYLPVLYFPLGKERQSGFLYPKIGYSNTGKMTLKVPYYFNLAPNYDAIVTASYYGSRGFALQKYSRFLTEKSAGSLHFMEWLGDKEFRDFKTDFTNTFATDDSAGVAELSNALMEAPDNRRFVYYSQTYEPLDFLKLSLKYAWLSDDYMRSDFDEVRELLPERRLPRFLNATLDRKNIWVNFTWAEDDILQPLGKTILKGLFSSQPDLYMRRSFYNDAGFSFKQQLQVLGFAPATDIDLSSDFDIEGFRTLYEAQLGYANRSISHSLQATLGVYARWYDWHQSSSDFLFGDSADILTPWLTVDNKWHFTNSRGLFVTPRLLFKYAPYKNQDDLPLLDAGYNASNYSRLFSINRFTGADRFGDTSSFVFGLENKIVSPTTGLVTAMLNIGKSYDMHLHKTCLGGNCELDEQSTQHWSDWVVAANVLGANSSWVLDWAVDHKLQQTDNLYLALEYQKDTKLYYHYAKLIDPYDATLVKNKILGYSYEAALSRSWSAFGDFEYDTSEHNFFNYVAGLKYKSCCLDVKIGLKRHYSGVNGYGKTQYNNSVVFEFALPGLGS